MKTDQTPEVRPEGPKLILKSDIATSVQHFDGKIERFETEESFKAAYPTSSVRLTGADAATGAPVTYSTSTGSEGPKGVASPKSRHIAFPSEGQSDGAGSAVIKSPNGSSERVVFRLANGQPLLSTLLLGWLDDETLVVLATGSSSRMVAAVPLTGSARVIKNIPDNVIYTDARGGFVWLMTGTIGEGLETPPAGPSELVRVSRDGSQTIVARDELRVIQGIIVDEANHVAYTTDDGQSFALTIGDDASKSVLGDRRPLLFLPDGRLIIRDRFALAVYDLSAATASPIGLLPEGGIQVFLFE